MEIIKDIDDWPDVERPVVTIGVFDGLHLAHRLIIDELIAIAKSINGHSVVVTFDVHPAKIVAPERFGNDLFLLTTLEEKIELFQKTGIDYLVIQTFNKAFSSLSYTDYIKDFLVKKIHPHMILVGYNHNFGKNREGDYSKLQELGKLYGFETDMFPEQLFENGNVSSTVIRNLLLSGEIERANEMLGYSYSMQGKIRKERFIPEDKAKLVPAYGPYKVLLKQEDGEYLLTSVVGTEISFLNVELEDDDDVKLTFIERLD